MRRVLYHGSTDKIAEPKFGFGKQNNDYGFGFYCTESLELAKGWAVVNPTMISSKSRWRLNSAVNTEELSSNLFQNGTSLKGKK